MEIIFKIIGIGLITCISALVLRPVRSDFAMLITIVGGVIILVMVLSSLSSAVNMISLIASKTGVDGSLLGIIFKIVGIGYLTEITASLCADAGSAGLGDKVLLGGKVVILMMSLPIVTNILSIIMELLPK